MLKKIKRKVVDDFVPIVINKEAMEDLLQSISPLDEAQKEETMVRWHITVPPRPGEYLVSVKWMDKIKVFVDYYNETLGFMEFRDNVIAWAHLPEPFKEE